MRVFLCVSRGCLRSSKEIKEEYLTHNLNRVFCSSEYFSTLSCLVNFFVLENETDKPVTRPSKLRASWVKSWVRKLMSLDRKNLKRLPKVKALEAAVKIWSREAMPHLEKWAERAWTGADPGNRKDAQRLCCHSYVWARGVSWPGQHMLLGGQWISPPELYVNSSFTQVREPASYLIPQCSMFLKENLIMKLIIYQSI